VDLPDFLAEAALVRGEVSPVKVNENCRLGGVKRIEFGLALIEVQFDNGTDVYQLPLAMAFGDAG
jgi:hypothetical protein